ncbi:MAG: GntR family transcriptional regulator [Desulfobacteraceae bacterium]
MEKIVISTLHQEVAKRIRELISAGALKKGQKIDEKALCESMGVSRTPVRESLRILHSEGLIDLIPHRGAYVSKPCIEDIQEMFEVMSTLEGMCARLAVQNLTPQDLKRIESLHGKLEQYYGEWDHRGYLEHNEVLHLFVQELAGNKILNEVIDGLRRKILLYRHEQLYRPERFHQSVQEHREILDAFQLKDPAAAESVMKRHLLNQGKALVGLYASKKEKGKRQAA